MTVAATGSTTNTTGTTGSTDTVGLGRTQLAQNFDMFLTLLTAQMKAQDPLSPMDSNQFTAQLVQMTGVEQQLASNDLLKQLVSNTGTSLSSSVGLIGKQVRALTTDANLANGKANWTYNLPTPASDLKLEVLDSTGKVVYAEAPTGDAAKAGDHPFAWNGKASGGSQLPDGTYTLRVTAKNGQGEALTSTTYVEGVVSGVEQGANGATLTINGGKVAVSNVVSVAEPASSSSATNTNTASQTPAQAA